MLRIHINLLYLLFFVSSIYSIPISSWTRTTGGGKRAIGSSPAGSPPFMTLKPAFLPSFIPDPKIFLDKKTELLNNLFSASTKSLGSKRALGPPSIVPFSPWAPPPPTTMDPSIFMGKKADFLSKLFSSIEMGPTVAPTAPKPPIVPADFWFPFTTPATPSLAAPVDPKTLLINKLIEAINEESPARPPILLAPAAATTVPLVPPSYWIPTNPLTVGPGDYMTKVSDFLDKVFSSINMTSTSSKISRSLYARHHNNNNNNDQQWIPQDYERAVTTDGTSPTAKDFVFSSILSEVANLKTSMMDALNGLIEKQKELAATTTKKPPKFYPPWMPTPKPTLDPTEPYEKRIETIGQVFDMLTTLGQAISNTTADATTRTSRSVPLIGPLPGRSVQMAIHQGYQSMPPGTEEIVSAGAGRDPDSAHEGGGLNLKIKIPQ